MTKFHPEVYQGIIKSQSSERLTKHVRKMRGEVGKLDEDMGQYRDKAAYFMSRRLCKEFRDPTFPFPNSSDIVIPMMDMLVDKLSVQFVANTLGQQRIVRFVPQRESAIANAHSAELFMNWFLQYKCEDLLEETWYAADRFLQDGFCIIKCFWEHRTIPKHVTILRENLPERYKRVMVTDIPQAEADLIAQITNGMRVPITKKEFDSMAPQIKEMVSADFDLDPDESSDMKSIDKIMNFLRNPMDTGDKVVIKKRQIDYSWPKMQTLSLDEIIVSPYCRSIRHSPTITHKLFLDRETLEQQAYEKDWNKDALDLILKGGASEQPNWITRRDIYSSSARSGPGVSSSNGYEIWETCSLYDIDGDGKKEDCVFVYNPNKPDVILDAYENPFANGKRPYIKIDFEHMDSGMFSPRGIPEKIDDLDIEVTVTHRNKINRMWIANGPMFKYRVGSEIKPNKIKFQPGGFIPVITMGDIEPMQIPNLDISFDREEQILRAYIEQYVGGTDFGLTSQTNMADSRTAQEIRAIEYNRQQIMSTRMLAFKKGLGEVWNFFWDMMMQYPKDTVFIATTGADPIRLTQQEIVGDYEIMPVGAIGFNDPVFEAQKALARINVIMQSLPVIQGSVTYDVKPDEAVRLYLEIEDIVHADHIMRRRSPQEIQQIQQQQAQRQALIQKVQDNIPADPAELHEYSKLVEKTLPYGRGQRVAKPGNN